MSRGLGRIQKSILDGIDALGGKVQQNQLLWHLAELNGKISRGRQIYDDIYEGAIEKSYKNSFLRATGQLAENDKVQQEDRFISELQELFHYYTFKTFSFEIFSLRKQLLPVLMKFLESGDSYYSPHTMPRFNTGDHEIFILGNKKNADPEFRKKMNAKWLYFESKILQNISTGKTSEPDIWMRLLIKGRQLFLEETRLNYKLSFHTILEKLLSIKDDLSKPELRLLDRIERFISRVFNEVDIRRAILKTTLYRLGSFQKKGGAATLHKEVKGFLLNECPDLIMALPGHKEPPVFFRGTSLYELTTFSDILNRLLDRHVFSSLRFLSIK